MADGSFTFVPPTVVVSRGVSKRLGIIRQRGSHRHVGRGVRYGRSCVIKMQGDEEPRAPPALVISGVSVLATTVGILLLQFPLPDSFTDTARIAIGSLAILSSAAIIIGSRPTKPAADPSEEEADEAKVLPSQLQNTSKAIEKADGVVTAEESNGTALGTPLDVRSAFDPTENPVGTDQFPGGVEASQAQAHDRETKEDLRNPVKIKVFGIGGGGSNAVDRMMPNGLGDIEFYTLNTDIQALARSKAEKIVLGTNLTKGLGAGGIPSIGQSSAEENTDEIVKAVSGADMIFITAGMGGGTGSGAAPVVARIAREMGILTVGVVTKPFAFEGHRRQIQANSAIERLRAAVDTLIIISNDKLLNYVPESMPLQSAFSIADDVLRQGIIGLSEILIRPGLVNVDFADVRTTMLDAGIALMGIGRASGDDRAVDAAKIAITSPLLDYQITNAEGVIFNITGNKSMTLLEVNQAAEVVHEAVGEDAEIFFGAIIDENAGDEVSLTVVATGIEKKPGEGPESATEMQRESSKTSNFGATG
uniref:Plastid division protein FtsZ n=1 Tax=Rhodosorus marinus TaxID=101924 RepID=A0A7S2ZAX3_9RHOD|mmetsp:Transcript_12886/g.51452  ORF Transcript_12886/g.51452 Transcript_12886/m.51452 type:complete len:534 (+) Transcript_12886:212-1813(+)